MLETCHGGERPRLGGGRSRKGCECRIAARGVQDCLGTKFFRLAPALGRTRSPEIQAKIALEL